MSDVTISYKGADIATMDASGTKTLQTQGKYCEGDIEVAYVKPSGGGGYDPYPIPEGYSLPSGYQKLVYIETDGYEGFDTLIVPNLNTKVEFTGYFIPGRYDGYGFMFGCPSGNLYIAKNSVEGVAYWGFGNKSDYTSIYNTTIGYSSSSRFGIPTFTSGKDSGVVSCPPFSDIIASCGATSFNASAPSIAISCKKNGNYFDRWCPIRFYGMRVWQSSQLVAIIVPVLKDGQEIGLYDLVNERFLPNVGSGTPTGVLP